MHKHTCVYRLTQRHTHTAIHKLTYRYCEILHSINHPKLKISSEESVWSVPNPPSNWHRVLQSTGYWLLPLLTSELVGAVAEDSATAQSPKDRLYFTSPGSNANFEACILLNYWIGTVELSISTLYCFTIIIFFNTGDGTSGSCVG